MGFMRMFATRERFTRIEDERGETVYFGPLVDSPEVPDGGTAETDDRPRWYARLSAPGYLDCTDWLGPAKTEDEAVAMVDEAFDLCSACHDNHEGEECATAE